MNDFIAVTLSLAESGCLSIADIILRQQVGVGPAVATSATAFFLSNSLEAHRVQRIAGWHIAPLMPAVGGGMIAQGNSEVDYSWRAGTITIAAMRLVWPRRSIAALSRLS